MKNRAIIWVLVSGVSLSGRAEAANSVVVESKTVMAGAQGVVIGVRVTNDFPLAAVIIPLKIREVSTGSFITDLALSWGGRMDSVMTDAVINYQYSTENYICESYGGIGFRDIATRRADSSRTVGASPEGAMFARIRIASPTLSPGTDITPSMRMIVNVTNTLGTFEVDTTCTVVSNHLQFVRTNPTGPPTGLLPSFTKGIVTIAACNCVHHGDLNGDAAFDVFDLMSLIDYVFGGYPIPPTDQGCPHVDRGDVNCDGGDDVLDVIYLNDYLFSNGPAPCDPCACSPYPTNCP